MPEKKGNNKIGSYLTIALIIVIVIAVGIYTYTTFVKKVSNGSEENQPPTKEPLLTITVGEQVYNYTLDELMTYDSISGQGGYINKAGKITGPKNYTGISVNTLADSLLGVPNNYTIYAIASDGYNHTYLQDEIQGHVSIYNEIGAEIRVGNLSMIIAYEENGILLNETTGGPLRIAFIDTAGSITNSGLWLRSLVELEIIE